MYVFYVLVKHVSVKSSVTFHLLTYLYYTEHTHRECTHIPTQSRGIVMKICCVGDADIVLKVSCVCLHLITFYSGHRGLLL